MASLFEILGTLADPIVFLLLSAAFLPLTILRLILSLQICTLLSPSLFQHAWLANFWRVIGPLIARNSRPQVKPLISLAEGVVLDIGPGNGEWLSLFDKSKITKIYGIEPNTDHHEVLRERTKRAGLDGKYEIVPVGVEDLGSDWVSKKSVDTVITVHCLCSVPEPKRMIRELYEYLKIGGRWIVYEHIVVYGHQGSFMRKYQAAIDVFWPFFQGGCSITRDTGKMLKESGSWSEVDLKQSDDEIKSQYHCIPHLMGVLTK